MRATAARVSADARSVEAAPGASSGLHRKQARKPPASASAAVRKKRHRARPGLRAGQMGRQ